jgi:hypothetical protein
MFALLTPARSAIALIEAALNPWSENKVSAAARMRATLLASVASAGGLRACTAALPEGIEMDESVPLTDRMVNRVSGGQK